MKTALPGETKIAKEARETVQECVSEFISFITSEACEKCTNDKRKTINGDDLIYGLNQLGFDRYLENLNLYYQKYKEVAKTQDKQNEEDKNDDMYEESKYSQDPDNKENDLEEDSMNESENQEDEEEDEEDEFNEEP
mmetsp:Transcript_43586/g.42109  ORF Transcript_43586/g.42109 Transcript_43586/m.42109 type:complete len:137 (+) Transcript_43586:65-475(+)